MNGREECEYLFFDSSAMVDLAAETGGSWGQTEGGEEGELWMDEVSERKEGVSGGGLCPADSQAAGWWSHLSTQSAAEMTGQLCGVT